MNKKVIRVIVTVLSAIILAMFLLFGITLWLQNAEEALPAETPELIIPTPRPTPEIIAVQSITILLENNEVTRGTEINPLIIIYPSNATDQEYVLHSDNVNVIRRQVDRWIAVDVGSANLIATASNGITGSILVTVMAPPLEEMFFQENHITMMIDDMIILSPVLIPHEAFMFEPIKYSSDNEDVVTIANDGRVTALDTGTAIITAAVGDITAQVEISVIIPVRNINIIMNRRIFSVGDEAHFTIEVDPPNATNADVTVSFDGAQATSTGRNSFICDEAGEVIVTFTAENGSMVRHTIVVYDLAVLASEVHRLTNVERSNAGLPRLGSNQPLVDTALLRASEIIVHLSHTRPDGREYITAFDENNVSYRIASENLAAGQQTPADVVREWMESAGHRSKILNRDFGNMGVGVKMDNTGKLYWTQTFSD